MGNRLIWTILTILRIRIITGILIFLEVGMKIMMVIAHRVEIFVFREVDYGSMIWIVMIELVGH